MKNPNRRSKRTSVAGAGNGKQDHEKRIRDLELENEAFKREIEELKYKLANGGSSSPLVGMKNLKEDDTSRSNARQEQLMSSKSKPNTHSRSAQKQKNERAAEQFDNEVQKLKAQKVKLQCKIKLDSVQFRLCKASLEKEILQLKKEQRRRELEIRVLLGLNRRQKFMLQRKKSEAIAAVKQLRRLQESKKTLSSKIGGPAKGNSTRIQDTKHELEMTMRLHELHSDYERQMEEIAEEIKKFRLGADVLKADMLIEDSSFLSQDNQVDSTPVDSELRELKQEFARLSTLVSQREMIKPQLSESDRSQVDRLQSSVSSVANIHASNVESSPTENSQSPPSENFQPSPPENSQPSPPEDSQGTISTMKKTETDVCCSCTKRSLCKTYKCECKAARSSCGASCGCTTAKCTNREASVKSDKALQLDNVKEDAAACSDSAGNDRQKPPELNDDRRPKKQPLREIGNTLANALVGKAGRRKKEHKPVTPPNNADPAFLGASN